MQSSNNYIPNSNNISRVYNVAAVLWLQLMAYEMQFPMINILYFSIIITILLLLLLLSLSLFLLPPLCRVLTIIYLTQTMFLGCTAVIPNRGSAVPWGTAETS